MPKLTEEEKEIVRRVHEKITELELAVEDAVAAGFEVDLKWDTYPGATMQVKMLMGVEYPTD